MSIPPLRRQFPVLNLNLIANPTPAALPDSPQRFLLSFCPSRASTLPFFRSCIAFLWPARVETNLRGGNKRELELVVGNVGVTAAGDTGDRGLASGDAERRREAEGGHFWAVGDESDGDRGGDVELNVQSREVVELGVTRLRLLWWRIDSQEQAGRTRH